MPSPAKARNMRLAARRRATPPDIQFVRLPYGLRRDITGGCACPYCTAHPDKTPQWDALGVDASGNTWIVHHPEPLAVGEGPRYQSLDELDPIK